MRKGLQTIAIIAALFFVSGFVFAGGSGESQESGKEISLTYMNWEEGVAWTHFIAAVLEDELGYKVKLTAADVGFAYASIFSGDQDFLMEAWLPGLQGSYVEGKVEGQDYEEVSAIYENAVSGLVVPTFMAEEGVTSISDLTDPQVVEKLDGKIIGVDAGAGMMITMDERVIPEYGLDKAGLQLIPSSSPAMLAEMESRIANGEYVVGMGWQPHSMFGAMDLTILKQDGVQVWPIDTLFILGRPGARQDLPVVCEFLNNVFWTNDTIGALMVYINESNLDTMAAAREWKDQNPDVWTDWIPAL